MFGQLLIGFVHCLFQWDSLNEINDINMVGLNVWFVISGLRALDWIPHYSQIRPCSCVINSTILIHTNVFKVSFSFNVVRSHEFTQKTYLNFFLELSICVKD